MTLRAPVAGRKEQVQKACRPAPPAQQAETDLQARAKSPRTFDLERAFGGLRAQAPIPGAS